MFLPSSNPILLRPFHFSRHKKEGIDWKGSAIGIQAEDSITARSQRINLPPVETYEMKGNNGFSFGGYNP